MYSSLDYQGWKRKDEVFSYDSRRRLPALEEEGEEELPAFFAFLFGRSSSIRKRVARTLPPSTPEMNNSRSSSHKSDARSSANSRFASLVLTAAVVVSPLFLKFPSAIPPPRELPRKYAAFHRKRFRVYTRISSPTHSRFEFQLTSEVV